MINKAHVYHKIMKKCCACLLCEEFEELLMVLLIDIEASHSYERLGSTSRKGVKENRELKRLSSSINYESRDGHSSRRKVEGGVTSVSL